MFMMFLSYDDESPSNLVHGADHPAEEACRLIVAVGGRVVESHRGRGDYDQFLLYSLPDEAAERDLAARRPSDRYARRFVYRLESPIDAPRSAGGETLAA